MNEKIKMIEEIKNQIENLKKEIIDKQLALSNLLEELEEMDNN